MRPSSSAILPSRLASPTGAGSIVFNVMSSSQPGSRTIVAAAISSIASIR
jgi:hypothetical protein